MKEGKRYFCWLLVLVAFYIFALSESAGARQPSFSLEDVMSAPHTSQLVASRRGNRVAWVLEVRGKKSLWLAEAPAYASRRLVNYEQDDGQAISDLQFRPDGEALLYCYGSSFNPKSSPHPAEQVIKLLDLKSGKETELVKGASPIVSPDGRSLLFLRGGEPWVMAIDRNVGARRLFQARGKKRSLQVVARQPEGGFCQPP